MITPLYILSVVEVRFAFSRRKHGHMTHKATEPD